MTTTTDDLFDSPGRPPRADDDLIKNGRYCLPHPVSGREMSWTRATTFAKTISDTYTLNMWGRRMAIKGLTMREDLYTLAAATSLDDRETLNKIAEQAAEHAGSKVGASLGTALHAFTEQHDKGEPVTAPARYRPHVAVYASALAEHGVEVVPGLIERVVICSKYGVAGRLDRIFRVVRDCVIELPDVEPFTLTAGTFVIGDLKTGRDLSYGWGEITVQLAIYRNADLMFNETTRSYEPLPELDDRVAMVAHLPATTDAAVCTMFDVNITKGWNATKLCAATREWRKEKGLAVPRLTTRAALVTGDAEPEIEIEDPAGWGARIEAARTVADLSAIYAAATLARQWTPALEALGMARRALILADTMGS